ncbi:VOC family protein [Gluconobacter wancherniae]|uniref:VOC family protein n=1 Tax=Gluconobacter wancherniae TaxID=1307955 RepID=UPI001B8C25F5|nr:VOC family protein [Gluconobacter wancherniae]MBS1063861.1 VOC family protein [Gluconobacter wancherniae]MBS1095782.1 VOC family protein [Gluconobacter wancherniae]
MKKDYSITFFYYEDMTSVIPFYEEVLGFELVLDQGMARIYRVGAGSYFGIVDGNRGHLQHQPRSAVLLTIVAEDVEGWHARMVSVGASSVGEIQKGRFCEHFFFEDPAGYAIEIQRFHDPSVAALFQA